MGATANRVTQVYLVWGTVIRLVIPVQITPYSVITRYVSLLLILLLHVRVPHCPTH